MLQNDVTIHGSYAMIFIIHNQTFLMLGEILSNPFNLLDAMTQNTSHSLKLKAIHKGTFDHWVWEKPR